MQPRELLGLIAFFNESLDAGHLDALAAGVTPRSFPEGAVLMREDEPGTSMFVIESGTVAVAISGEEKPVANLYAGDIVGEISLLTGEPRTATVTAIEPVEAVEVDKSHLAPILATSPALVERFAETMERRQAQLDEIEGNPGWGVMRQGRAEFVAQIRKFYDPDGTGELAAALPVSVLPTDVEKPPAAEDTAGAAAGQKAVAEALLGNGATAPEVSNEPEKPDPGSSKSA